MNIYIALLRGINVSGQKKIKMADLKILFERLGFASVVTYIQSGNVVFQAEDDDKEMLVTKISEMIEDFYSFQVPVLVMTYTQLNKIFANCPFKSTIREASYFTLLHTSPEEDRFSAVTTIKLPDEEFYITSDCVYFYSEKGYGRAKGTNNFFEKKLGVTATTRNYKTMAKLIELSS